MIVEYKGIKPQIHERTFIAENSSIIGNVKIGAESSVVVGCPAKVVKSVDEAGIESNRLNAEEYVQFACEYGKWEK